MDLQAYLTRTASAPPATPDLTALRALHLAHVAAIPFENLDIRLGRPIRLDLPSLEDKLVRRRRGGYCFEHGAMFAAALRELGFEVTTLEARVRPPGSTATLPRTHMVLRVDLGGRAWLADVGFGGDGPLWPVALDGEPSPEPEGALRVRQEADGVHVLERQRAGSWTPLYAFGLSPALPVDYEVANHFTSTHPSSRFVLTLTVQRSTAHERHILRGQTCVHRTRAGETSEAVTADNFGALLRERFGLQLTDDEARAALLGGGPPVR